ncbi:MAG: hypothetical protein QXI97_06710 [Nitrososphaerota archaeon]
MLFGDDDSFIATTAFMTFLWIIRRRHKCDGICDSLLLQGIIALVAARYLVPLLMKVMRVV